MCTLTALKPCNETNDIRLALGTLTLGRLEVCSGGYWKSVCGIGTTNATATVACRQLDHVPRGLWDLHAVYDKPCSFILQEICFLKIILDFLLLM